MTVVKQVGAYETYIENTDTICTVSNRYGGQKIMKSNTLIASKGSVVA